MTVLAEVKEGFAFTFEGHDWVKGSEYSQGCVKVFSIEDNPLPDKWLALSRDVEIL